MRFIKLWDGITDWRYAKSPYHMHLFIHCLLEAWHADAKEFKRGTFRTSYPKLSDQTGIGRKKIIELLKDLSTGDNPEIKSFSKKGYSVGYTEITILNYDKYQSNVSDSTSNVSHRPSNVSHRPSNVSHRPSNVSLGHPKEEYRDKNIQEYTQVTDERFLSRLNKYPKRPDKFDLKFFNELALDDQMSFSKFIEDISKIWETNGNKSRTQYVKKIEDVVKMYINDELKLDTQDPLVISTVLKIDKPLVQEERIYTIEEHKEKERKEKERMIKMIEDEKKKKLAQEKNNN